MRYTLLEAVQYILSSMDSDEVNNYDDTVESLQIARLLRAVYYDMATDLSLPEHHTLFELDASGDNAKPTLMTVPSTVTKLEWIKYNNALTTDTNAIYKRVEFLPFDQFFEMQSALYQQTTGVGEMTFVNNGEDFEVMYRTDRAPLYYTTMDDYTVLFDSYNNDEDTTLQKSKTMCWGAVYPTFTLSNSFAPDLDPTQFSLWLNQAKVRAFAELKQVANNEAAGTARRQMISTQRNNKRIDGLAAVFTAPRYGRTTGGTADRIPQKLKNGE